MPASTLRAVEIAMRTAASLLSPAPCGVRITLGKCEQRMVVRRRLPVEHIQAGTAILPDVVRRHGGLHDAVGPDDYRN